MESSVSIHDRFQVELKVGYLLPADGKKTQCELDMYVFAPGTLGVTPETYSHQQFYIDLQANIRLKTPVVSLTELVDGASSPLSRLHHIFKEVAEQPRDEISDDYENQIKLYCCMFKSAVRNFVSFVNMTPNRADRIRLAGVYCENVQMASSGYRDLLATIQAPGVKQRTLDYFYFGDEYISLVVEDYTCHLAETLSGDEPAADMVASLLNTVRGEVAYRKERGYASIAEEYGDNETLIFRKSVLKKYMASILFLNTETRKEGVLLEQALFGVAAAVAMVFATTVTFLSQSLFDVLTLPFFVAIVISYIFKDRIKDLLRYYMSRKISCYIFDKKTNIYDASKRGVGYCKESFEFVGDRKVPAEIVNIRNRDHITEIENGWVGEQVLLYRKRVCLYPEKVQNIFSDYDVMGINDIMRFNIREFLRRMDDPKKELFIMDDDAFLPARGSRVYHINMIVRLVHGERTALARYRVVMNRKGIKRIESVHVGG